MATLVDTPAQSASRSDGLSIARLGTLAYREALVVQANVQARRQADELPDTLLLLEHPPVYTRGRRSLDSELSLGEDFYRSRGIEIVSTDRGGRVTYHGPGQLVGYPIMRVSDIGTHLRRMEAAIVAALAEHGVLARSRCDEGIDYTGVWVEDRKIASIGVHVSRGVSTHGFAINLTNDLEPFEWIVACGLEGVAMTSLSRELGHEPQGGIDAFAQLLARCFCEVHERTPLALAPASFDVSEPNLGVPEPNVDVSESDVGISEPNVGISGSDRATAIAYPLGHR
jgi:lipoyl(octanoyl) transferase